MPWGSGSISGPDAAGLYEVRLSLGLVDGKRRRVRARVGTVAAARAKLDELRARYGKARGKGPAPRLDAYLTAWLAARAPELEAKSIRSYTFGADLVGRRIGHVRLDRLTHEQIAGALEGLRKDGKGARTRQVVYDTLRAALNWAVKRDRVLTANPIVSVARPKVVREIDFLARDEAKAFLEAVADDPYRALFHLTIAVGLRLGEVSALTWRDIDLNAGSLTVTKSLKESRAVGRPKSKGSRRRIDLPPSIVTELRAHEARSRFRAPTELVFPSATGTALHPSNFERRHFFPALARAELRRIRFHDLRHTAAAIRLLAGEHPSVIQAMLGHASIRTTLDVYGHLADTIGRAAADRYDETMA
jgi:integrase